MLDEKSFFNLRTRTEKRFRFRILASFIDHVLIFFLQGFYIISFGEPNNDGGYSINGLFESLPVLLIWVLFTIGLEQLMGASIGNKLMGYKPISIKENDEGGTPNYLEKPTILQSTIRYLLFPLDVFVFFGLPAIICMKNTVTYQRIGDLFAKTTIIKTRGLNN